MLLSGRYKLKRLTKNFRRNFFRPTFWTRHFGQSRRSILSEIQKYRRTAFDFFRNPDFSTDHPGTKISQRCWARPTFLDSLATKYGIIPEVGSAIFSPKKLKKSNSTPTARGAILSPFSLQVKVAEERLSASGLNKSKR